MEPRDALPPVTLALKEREPVARPGPAIAPRWRDVDTAAQYLCMSRHALYHRVSRKQIPFVRHGRIVRFDRKAIDRWMARFELRSRRQSLFS